MKCKCGCGKELKEGNKFIQGHNRRGKTAWNKGKKCPQLSGKHNPAKRLGVREKISKTLTGRKLSEEHIKNIEKNHWTKNEKIQKQVRQRISRKLKGELSPHYGKPRSEKTRKKISESHKGMTHTEVTKKKISKLLTGRKFKPETIKKLKKLKNEFWKSEKGKKLKNKVMMPDGANKAFNYDDVKGAVEWLKKRVTDYGRKEVTTPWVLRDVSKLIDEAFNDCVEVINK